MYAYDKRTCIQIDTTHGQTNRYMERPSSCQHHFEAIWALVQVCSVVLGEPTCQAEKSESGLPSQGPSESGQVATQGGTKSIILKGAMQGPRKSEPQCPDRSLNTLDLHTLMRAPSNFDVCLISWGKCYNSTPTC